MKYFFIWFFVFAILTMLLPLSINIGFGDLREESVDFSGESIKVYFHKEGKTKEMKLEEYIMGVLMAEMPAEFEIEALKAQAVAARTYTVQKLITGKNEHNGAQVCTDSAHCQAYITAEDAKKGWDKNSDKYYQKCYSAVMDTEGIVAVFNGEPIKAVFHSVSGGRTENASEVWGGGAEYLKSVSSPGEESAPKYRTELSLTSAQFKEKLKGEFNVDFSKSILGNVERTEGGSVKTIELYGAKVKGTDVRRIFDLSSADFEISVGDDTVTFRVTGYGHGVGMSQYGANYCAKEGMNYEEILKKYYTGISLAKV